MRRGCCRVVINDGRVVINEEMVGEIPEKHRNNIVTKSGKHRNNIVIKSEIITHKQQAILDSISEKPRITIRELSTIVGISNRKIQANIQKLKAKGLLKRVGANKGGYWEIN